MSEPDSPPASDTSPLPTHLPELGRLATWSVSSHKYGFGVENLRDGNDNTFWQSEGPQPHTIDLSFPKRMFVSYVAILTSHPRDDSYTPSRISIRAGTTVHDLQEVRFEEFLKPDGWIVIALRPNDAESGETGAPIPAYHLRIVIVANHLNGKDTHVRGLKVYGPGGPPQADTQTTDDSFPSGPALLELGHDGTSLWTNPRFKMHAGIR